MTTYACPKSTLPVLLALTALSLTSCQVPYAQDTKRDFSAASAEITSQTPASSFCEIHGYVSLDLVVLQLSESARRSGARRGDKILAIDDVSVPDLKSLMSQMIRRSPGDRIEVTVERSGHELKLDLTCENGLPTTQLLIAALDAGGSGRWDDCLLNLQRFEQQTIPSSITVSLRLRCSESKRGIENRAPDLNDALLIHSAGRIVLEEAAFNPAGVPPVRGIVLSHADWLNRMGFNALAQDMQRLLAEAEGHGSGAGGSKGTTVEETGAPRFVGLGTCFSVQPDGYLVTANHVIEKAEEIVVRFADGRILPASVHKTSAANDVAVLKVNSGTPHFVPVAGTVKLGQRVFTLGYPAIEVLGGDPKYSDCTVSALSGFQGEAGQLQISVPLQPGNSGGPLLNDFGEVVGVAIANSAAFYSAYSALPQSVSWATKGEYLAPILPEVSRPARARNRDEAIDRAIDSLCLVATTSR